MTITDGVQKRLRLTTSDGRSAVVKIPPRNARKPDGSSEVSATDESGQRSGHWQSDEHDRFLLGLERFPDGPWKKIAEMVLTRNVRQTMTHAQKYWMRIKRHRDGLRRGTSLVPSAEDHAANEEAADEYEPLDDGGDASFRVSEEEILLALFRG